MFGEGFRVGLEAPNETKVNLYFRTFYFKQKIYYEFPYKKFVWVIPFKLIGKDPKVDCIQTSVRLKEVANLVHMSRLSQMG